jgi:hypothetical protein
VTYRSVFAPISPPSPKAVCWSAKYGSVTRYVFLAPASELIAAGLVARPDLPKSIGQCRFTMRGDATLLKSGKIKLSVPAARVIARDAEFQIFMARIQGASE